MALRVPPGLEGVLSVDPEIMSGSLCFAGTRVPVTVLIDNLAEGIDLERFFENYPTVTNGHVQALLAWQREQLVGREAA